MGNSEALLLHSYVVLPFWCAKFTTFHGLNVLIVYILPGVHPSRYRWRNTLTNRSHPYNFEFPIRKLCLFLDWRRSRWRVKAERCNHTDTGTPHADKNKLCLKAKAQTFTLPGHCYLSCWPIPAIVVLNPANPSFKPSWKCSVRKMSNTKSVSGRHFLHPRTPPSKMLSVLTCVQSRCYDSQNILRW